MTQNISQIHSSQILELEAELHTSCNISPGYIQGNIPILISVPHCLQHTREGHIKKAETNTYAIARLLHDACLCHVIFNTDTSIDPNYDATNDYKTRIIEIINTHGIRFALDLHGAAENRDFDFELGTCNSANIGGNSLPADLFVSLAKAYGNFVDIDNHFKACNPNTISSYVFNRTGIGMIQIEINSKKRDCKDILSFNNTFELLKLFISYISCINFDFNNYLLAEVEVCENTHPHNRIELPQTIISGFSINEICEINGSRDTCECQIKQFIEGDKVRVGKRVFDRMFADSPIALIHKENYETVNVYKPRIETIDNDNIYLSTDIFNRFKGYKLLEIYSPLSSIRAYYPPRLYEQNINNRTNSIWLSYIQRRLLNIELPYNLNQHTAQYLKGILPPEDYHFLINNYHSLDGSTDLYLIKVDEHTHARMKKIFTNAAGKIKIRGISETNYTHAKQSAILGKYIGNVSIHLRCMRCAENDEILDCVMLSKNNIKRLGLSDGDKAYIIYRHKSRTVRIHLINSESYSQVVRINNLDSDNDIEMVACISARLRFELGINDINECVTLQRDLVYLVRKNITEQILAVIGSFIAIVSIPDLKIVHCLIIFIILIPFILYSILSKEREKI